MSKYLYTNWFELVLNKLDISEELEQSILSGNIIQLDRNIDKLAIIYSKTIYKWLNCLGYQSKKVQKGVFCDEYE